MVQATSFIGEAFSTRRPVDEPVGRVRPCRCPTDVPLAGRTVGSQGHTAW
jgi:hypothetical protein